MIKVDIVNEVSKIGEKRGVLVRTDHRGRHDGQGEQQKVQPHTILELVSWVPDADRSRVQVSRCSGDLCPA